MTRLASPERTKTIQFFLGRLAGQLGGRTIETITASKTRPRVKPCLGFGFQSWRVSGASNRGGLRKCAHQLSPKTNSFLLIPPASAVHQTLFYSVLLQRSKHRRDEVDKVVTGKAITTEKRLHTLKRRFFRPAALESKHVSTPSPAPRPGMVYGNIFPGVAALPFYSYLYMPRGQLEGTFFFASSRTRRLYSSLLVLPPVGKAWGFGFQGKHLAREIRASWRGLRVRMHHFLSMKPFKSKLSGLLLFMP